MRKQLIGAASAAALLLTGAAWAQSGGGSQSGPSTTEPPTTGQTTAGQTTTGQSTTPPSTATTPGASSSTMGSSPMTDSPSRSSTGSPGIVRTDTASAEQLLGKTVVGANGEEIGEVKDVILDPQSGQAKQLIIGSGGFLGIGQKNIPVDFAEAQLQPGQDRITVAGLTRAQVRDMKGYEYDSSTVSLTRRDNASGSSSRSGTTPTTTPPKSPNETPRSGGGG